MNDANNHKPLPMKTFSWFGPQGRVSGVEAMGLQYMEPMLAVRVGFFGPAILNWGFARFQRREDQLIDGWQIRVWRIALSVGWPPSWRADFATLPI